MNIRIEPIKPNIGANVHADRRALLNPNSVGEILRAVDLYDVLVFPRLDLSEDEQSTFTDLLGARTQYAETMPLGKLGSQGTYKVTLDPTINKTPEYILGTFFWHQDGMFYEAPPPKIGLLSVPAAMLRGKIERHFGPGSAPAR